MNQYWLTFIFIGIIQIIPTETHRARNIKLIISFLIIFIYMSLRANGFDYETYEETFVEIKQYYLSSNFESRMEEGYVILNYILPSFRFLIILLSAFTCITYYFLFHKYIPSKLYLLGFFLLAISGDKMLLFQMSGLRNAIAINIMALSIPLIVNRKIKPFIFLTIIAYFFHNSVLFFMPLAYFVATPTKFKTKEAIIWICFILFFMTVSGSSLIDYVSVYTNLYFDRYSVYAEIAQDDVYERSFLMYGYVILVATVTIYFLHKVNLSRTENVIVKLSLLFLLSLILGVLNFRMSQYFAPFLMLSCFVFIKNSSKPLFRFGYTSIVVIFLCFSFFIVYLGIPENSTYRYKSILEVNN